MSKSYRHISEREKDSLEMRKQGVLYLSVVFNAAVDYELLSNSLNEAEQIAKDYIDTEKKSLRNTNNFID